MKSFLAKFFDIKFWKFLLVGVLNTLIGEGVVLLMLHAFGWKQFSWGAGAAAFVGVVVGRIVSYFLNKYFTFRQQQRSWAEIGRFAVNISVCYALAYGLARPLARWALSSASASLQDNAAMVAGMCAFVGFHYLGQRFFVFPEKKG